MTASVGKMDALLPFILFSSLIRAGSDRTAVQTVRLLIRTSPDRLENFNRVLNHSPRGVCKYKTKGEGI